MIGGRKIIGICMTKIHNTTRSRAVSYIHEEIRRRGFKLIVFNNTFDFIEPEKTKTSEKIYELVNYDIIDGLIILTNGFMDKDVYRRIADRAAERNIPVVIEDEEYGSCVTVRNSFEHSLEALMNHVINDHGARDTFFIAGFKGNSFSEQRIEVYKKVLKDNGLEFSEDMLDYGNFWAGPTNAAVDRLLASGKKLPQAIFCANDAMAIAVCKKLEHHGIHVPEDVIVTGFDGSRLSEFTLPRLSTCVIDLRTFAKKAVDALCDIFDGKQTEKLIDNPFSLLLAASCGCSHENTADYRALAEENYNTAINIIGHEHYIFEKILSIMNSGGMDINTFYSSIAKIMDENSFIALDPSFLSRTMKNSTEEISVNDKFITITSSKLNAVKAAKRTSFAVADMIPEKEEWAKNDSLYVINQVKVGDIIFGYYECETYDIIGSAQMINRILNMITMIVHMAMSDMRQRFFKLEKSSETMIDPLTEVASLHGATVWYDEFLKRPESSVMTVSLYEIPRYKYVYEKYGLKDIEALVCYIAEALRIASPNNSFIARNSDNEFIVINWYANADEIAPVINNSVAVFYGLIEKFNSNNDKEYYIEVNAGCTYQKYEKLEQCILDATNALYQNKLIYSSRSTVKNNITSSHEEYTLFNALVSNNQFCYHFQPIVNAHTGDIYAYEALMRTDKNIGLNPLEVLSIAAKYDRLYDIEKATLFNVMERYRQDEATFGGRKVFINCIPGYVLREDDNNRLCKEYSNYISNFVFEITEQDTVTDSELQTIRSIANENGNNPIAVDDYGSGHSNIVNLIKYAPEIVKIDRFLMTDIHLDETKQMVVQSVLDFAKLNNIKVLAEGIETADELRKVIEMGVDYIQGYFTAKPAFDPIDEIAPEVKKLIEDTFAERTKACEMSAVNRVSLTDRKKLTELINSMKAAGLSSEQIIDLVKADI